MLALFAMVAVQAQSLLSEDFENGIPATWLNIDADNDSYAWMEGTAPGVSGNNGSNGCAYSCSYYDGTVLTPDNWLITPAVTLTGNSDLTFWVAAQDASYAAEHYGVYISTTGTATSNFTLLFEETLNANGGAKVQGTWKQKTISLANYTGQTVYIAFRHFNCTDMFYLNLDDVEITAQPTDPTIVVAPATINFGNTIIGTSKTSSAIVNCYNLTTNVTATTTAPFEVSADGTTYGTSATIAAAGGTLHVKYTPTAVGTDNGTVTLSSTGATSVTMTLSGTGMDCNATLPYSCNFTDAAQNSCWVIIDANADNNTFEIDDTEGYIYYSYDVSTPADEWALSPVFTMTSGLLLSLDYYVRSANYPEAFQIFAIGADTVALTSVMTVTNTTPQTLYLDLGNLSGNYQIAIHCVSDANMWNLYFTNFSIAPNAPTLMVNEETIDFGIAEMGGTSDAQMVVVTALNITDAISASVAAPFEISADGTTFGASLTFPASTAMAVNDTFYVRFAPTAAGTFSQTLTVTAGTLSQTIALSGEAVDCTPGITIPYTQNFNDELVPPTCWSIGSDPEVFMSLGIDEAGTDFCIGMEGVDMLITPEIHATDPILVSFDYINYAGTEATAPTYFHVGYSTTDNNPSSFTWQGENLCSTDAFTNYSTVVPAGTKYVAVGASQIGTFLYYGIFEMTDIFIIDNLTLTAQTEALLTVSPESMSFGSINLGSPAPVKTASVVGALLTSNISVTAPANFEVSANGTSYAATATLPEAGGTLYVRYNPSAAGYHNGTITVASGNTSKTIAVSGSAVDCSTPKTLPYTEDFEEGMPACWTILDQDGDGISWEDSYNPVSYYSGVDLSGSGYGDSDGFVLSGSYSNVIGALTPDNWLITPALVIPSEGAKLTWYVSAIDADYAAEYYDVMLSTSLNPSTFTSVFNETLQSDQWEQRSVNIGGNYAGQNVYVAFRNHNTNDIFLMKIDNVSVTPGTGVENHELNTTIFPNPANNVLNINANSNINRVEVYNMMGQMVGSYNVNDVNAQINTTAFANGVYTVKIATENGMSTQKFTVAR